MAHVRNFSEIESIIEIKLYDPFDLAFSKASSVESEFFI